MAQTNPVEILSDDDDPSSPSKFNLKRRRRSSQELGISSSVVILDDDPTPKKPSPTITSPSVVPDTPFSSFTSTSMGSSSFVKCTTGFSDYSKPGSSSKDGGSSHNKLSGFNGLICLESDDESGGDCEREMLKEDEGISAGFVEMKNVEMKSKNLLPTGSTWLDEYEEVFGDRPTHHNECTSGDGGPVVLPCQEEEKISQEKEETSQMQKEVSVQVKERKKSRRDETDEGKKKSKEEKSRLMEEKKLKREQEKLQKQALKAEEAERRKLQKEQQKFEKGKFALKSIVAEIDVKLVEIGSIGGHVITRFAEKGLTYRITSNPIARSICWKITVPEQLSELSSNESQVKYILRVFEADEFCKLVSDKSLMNDVSRVQNLYPSFTICYLTNRLKSYINKREQEQYKNPSNNTWIRPPVEEVLSKLTTDFDSVHSRQCVDEADLADHIVGLTCSLATCHFRKKMTRLSINANGSLVPKDFIDKNLIRKNTWLKVLVAIPKVQPRYAVAIWKKYPTMKSLLTVYMDPTKSVYEKEFLLKDLMCEGALGKEDRRRVGEICSKRVYRVLMAQNGGIKTDDIEDGADLFAAL